MILLVVSSAFFFFLQPTAGYAAGNEVAVLNGMFPGVVLYAYDGSLSGCSPGAERVLTFYWRGEKPLYLKAFACLALLDSARQLAIPICEQPNWELTVAEAGQIVSHEMKVVLPKRFGAGAYQLAMRLSHEPEAAGIAPADDPYWMALGDQRLTPGAFASELTDQELTAQFGSGWHRLSLAASLRKGETVTMPLPQPTPVKKLIVISNMRLGRLIPQGKKVASFTLATKQADSKQHDIRAGIDTAEGYSGNAQYPPKHRPVLKFKYSNQKDTPLFYREYAFDGSSAEAVRFSYEADEGCLIVEDVLYQ